ncbi:hypothetical protein [Solibacillus sp. FSL W8-0372]|uniref:hypothetical protein n=1 Tax=Solibacillus sp. FSL W8-0372 TaxID=2921713 RepID=UPI0030D19609
MIVNIILSGIVALIIAWFFADGALGDVNSFTPEFFLILPIWFIGVLLRLKMTSNGKLENTSYFHLLFNNLLLWVTIPIGYFCSLLFV